MSLITDTNCSVGVEEGDWLHTHDDDSMETSPRFLLRRVRKSIFPASVRQSIGDCGTHWLLNVMWINYSPGHPQFPHPTTCIYAPIWFLCSAPLGRKQRTNQLYRVSHLVIDMGLVDFDLSVPPFCPHAKPLLPNFHQSRQSWADSGTIKLDNQTKSTTRWDTL